MSRSGNTLDFTNFAVRNLQAMLKSAQTESHCILGSEFFDSFDKMRNFVDLSLDEFKHDLQKVVFPIFVCMFLNMIQKKDLTA